MMKSLKKYNDAVSPVVGVMLMLVVTIIIAAVVATFASGLVDTQSIAPQAMIEATYSQSGGMTISHAGGDALSLAGLTFYTTPGETMGTDYMSFKYEIPKSVIEYNGVAIMDATTGAYSRTLFGVGDTLTISRYNCSDRATTPEELAALANASKESPYFTDGSVNKLSQLNWGSYDSEKGAYFSAYEFMNPANIGNYFYLSVYDGSGNMISEKKITITA